MTVQAMNLSKSYGNVRAVDDLSFTVEPGLVTGFLGPNGSGKSTTMRIMLGLDRGDGLTLWDGLKLSQVPNAANVVGAHLDAKTFHPGRTARKHLRMLATASGVSNRRVDEVIELMGLGGVANKRPKGFSLGMAQRLGLAGAILANPRVLLLDEPANGLDPMSINWLRDFLRDYAAADRAVFVSSHLLNEMQLMADRVVVIAKGRLVADESMPQFVARSTRNDVYLRTPEIDTMINALAAEGINSIREGDGGLSVIGVDVRRVGELAFATGIPVWELTTRTASLEQAFLELTGDEQEFGVGMVDALAGASMTLAQVSEESQTPESTVAAADVSGSDAPTASDAVAADAAPPPAAPPPPPAAPAPPPDADIEGAPPSRGVPADGATRPAPSDNPFSEREDQF